MLTISKDQSTVAKGIAILVMFAHHLYAFPDRFDHIWGHPYLIQLGRDLGIVVGLFVFLSGIGLTATREKLKMTGKYPDVHYDNLEGWKEKILHFNEVDLY